MSGSVAIFLVGVIAASTGQVLMKRAAMEERERSLLRSFLNPWLAAGYLLMLSSTVTSTIALKVLPLRVSVTLLPAGYILVLLLSAVVLRETMKRHHFIGAAIILIGVVVFNLESL